MMANSARCLEGRRGSTCAGIAVTESTSRVPVSSAIAKGALRGAKRIDARDIEQLFARHPRPGIDQRARIDIAPCKHPRKRSEDVLERLELFQAANIRVRCRQVG